MTTEPDLVSSTSLAALQKALSGDLVVRGQPGYDRFRRVWNGSIDRHPALIVRCADVADVQTAVRFGHDRGLLTAIRGGGHSFPGFSTCDDGMVIDLGMMNDVTLDRDSTTVEVGAGALLGDLDRATLPHGLGVPSGIVSHTGVAGLTLGGGLGWQQRKYGLTIDNLEQVEMVTADGEVLMAGDEENADLFWGIRGGGGNFGIVTSFRFRTNPVGPSVVAGPVFWGMEEARQVLRFYGEWSMGLPDEVTTILVQRRLPALSSVPRDLVGKRVLAVVACHIGPIEEGLRLLAPLKSFGSPILDLCEPKPFLTHQGMFDASFPHGSWYYVRSCDVEVLNDEIIEVMVDFGNRLESPMSSIALWQMGGAVARVGDMDTAYHGRGAGYTFNINGNTETQRDFEDERRWARSYWSALQPYHTSVYVNFLMDEGDDRVRSAYGAEKYERLQELKRRHDPDNFFKLNQNIPPG